VTPMVLQMVHLQDVVKLHTFLLGHLGALRLACFGFDLRFALVAFDLVSGSIWCEGVGVGVGARGGSTCAGGDYLRGACRNVMPNAAVSPAAVKSKIQQTRY